MAAGGWKRGLGSLSIGTLGLEATDRRAACGNCDPGRNESVRVPDVGFAVHVVHGMERDRSSDEGLVLRRRGTGRGDASFLDVVGLAEVSSSIMLEEESVS